MRVSRAQTRQDFLRHTPEDHDDHANVNKALADMQQVAAYIEKKKEEAENIYHIMAIQDSLVGKFNVRAVTLTIACVVRVACCVRTHLMRWVVPNQTIVVPGRKYKFEGALSEAVASSKRTKRKTEGYYCFLFNDLFVVARRKGIISHIKKITAKRLRYARLVCVWCDEAGGALMQPITHTDQGARGRRGTTRHCTVHPSARRSRQTASNSISSNRFRYRPPPRPSTACPPKRLPSLAWKVSPSTPFTSPARMLSRLRSFLPL
jgi:hypothetical protein